ncbi:unnamed protein product [Soboliphyme baturini]|uniref:Short coiled-coil protein n=1 Tax=Soboliphyme baturini TaxID=241478 RepID=A0A183J2D2_9BILA|nr:unnamed protein product [Soboliphyme baturini]
MSYGIETAHLNNNHENSTEIPLADDEAQEFNENLLEGHMKPAFPLPKSVTDSEDDSAESQEEKARLISQVLELQNTLDDLSQRVDSVKEESLKLRSENQVLGQYIENLMAASAVFQPASPRSKSKK